MTKSKPHDEAAAAAPDVPEKPLADAFDQIREARNRIVAAVIDRACKDGSYQHAKWLFEFGGIVPAAHSAAEEEPSFMRLFLDRLQIPESPEELAAEFAANDPGLE